MQGGWREDGDEGDCRDQCSGQQVGAAAAPGRARAVAGNADHHVRHHVVKLGNHQQQAGGGGGLSEHGGHQGRKIYDDGVEQDGSACRAQAKRQTRPQRRSWPGRGILGTDHRRSR